ncbi:MAG: hypothetical protein WD768_18810 [Phycisphaeraceae bacterium]
MLNRLVILSLGLALLSGCVTIDQRIKEHQALFTSFPADTQDRLRRGEIVVGDTKDMVYIALGRPDRKFQRIDAGGVNQDVWSYTGVYYTSEIYWPRHRFHRRRHDHDDLHFHGPEMVDVRHEYEHLRIEFTGGSVAVIEQYVR